MCTRCRAVSFINECTHEMGECENTQQTKQVNSDARNENVKTDEMSRIAVIVADGQ